MIRRIATPLIQGLLILGMGSPAFAAQFSIEKKDALAGSTAQQLSLNVTTSPGETIDAFSFKVEWNANELSIVSADNLEEHPLQSPFSDADVRVATVFKANGEVFFNINHANVLVEEDSTATIALFEFDVASDAAADTLLPVQFTDTEQNHSYTPGGIQVITAFPAPVTVQEDSVDNDITSQVLGANDIADTATAITSVDEQPPNGSATLTPEGVLTYTPDADFSGTDTFQVSVDDPADIPVEVTVTVEPVNDAPTDIALSSNSVDENDAGAEIGDLTAEDVDTLFEGDNHTFEITSNYNDKFEIQNTALKLKDGEALDFETDTDVSLEITVTDSAGATFAKTMPITVNDIDEEPVYSDNENDPVIVVSLGALGTDNNVTEFQISGVSDPEGADLTYSNMSGLTVEETGGTVQNENNPTLDCDNDVCTFNAKDSEVDVGADNYVLYSFTFDVTDGTHTLDNQKYYLKMISDEPPKISWEDTPSEVDEGNPINITVAADDSEDAEGTPDNIESLQLTVDGGEPVDATVTTDGEKGTLTYTIETDQDTSTHETDTVFTLQVTVSDAMGAVRTEEWTVTVNDVNNPPSIDTVTVQAFDDADAEVTPSKPEEVAKLVGTASISDLDAEDFENGLPVDDDEVVFTWMLTRKGVNNDEPFQVASTTITAAAVPDPFEVVLDESALNTALGNQDATENGFQKDDQFVLVVTADDGAVDTPVENEEKITLGNPGWFPAISWAGDDDDYKVEVLAADAAGDASRGGHDETAIVTMYTTDPQVKVADYFAGQWDPEYLAGRPAGVERVFGLRPGNYEVKIPQYGEAATRSEDGWTELEDDSPQALIVDDYDAPTLTPKDVQDDDDDLAPLVGTFNLTSAAGYIVEVALVGEDGEETVMPNLGFQKLLRPEKGVLSTDRTVEVRLNAPAGTYNVSVTPFNPADVAAPAKLENFEGRDETSLPEEDENNPIEWGMSPGTDTKADASEAYVGKGTVDVEFSWDPIQGADHYRIVVYDAAGDMVEDLDNVVVNGTSYEESVEGLYTGVYLWHVKAINASGESVSWSPGKWFTVLPSHEDDTEEFTEVTAAYSSKKVEWTVPSTSDIVYVFAYDIGDEDFVPGFSSTGVVLDVNGTTVTLDTADYDWPDGEVLIGLSVDSTFWNHWYLDKKDGGTIVTVE